MSKANKWNFAKTMLIVAICGLGHVLSSVILGLIGIWFGSQLSSLVGIEDFRGELAVWFMIAFGAIYMLWGITKAIKNKPHSHILTDGSEVWHDHSNDHSSEPVNAHSERNGISRSFWPLFVLFVLGPCEPLIPLLMYPAAEGGMLSVTAVAIVFSVCTIGTMLLCAAVVLKGVNMIPVKKLERYAHSLAGFAIFMCGMAMQCFGV
jgi:sulfite exporter TauE/SafE